MPKQLELTLTIPPELGDPALVRQALAGRVRDFEDTARRERVRTNRRVLGARAVRAQSPLASPTTPRERTPLRPLVACRDELVRAQTLADLVTFRADYRTARHHLLANDPVPFPHGTYWLRRFVGVAVAPPPPPPAPSAR
jgi:hypothetical protein